MKEIIIENKRPIMTDNIPLCYRKLIEKCWSKEQDDRPTFEEIVYLLKMDPSYITSKVNKENYQKYIHFIDEQTNLYNKPLKIQEDVKEMNVESENLIYHQKLVENGNIESQEFLAKKFSLENDSENTYKYFSMLIKQGRCTIPLEYAVRLYNEKNYKQAFNYFCLISKVNHPIAKFYIGIMKFSGIGCEKNQKESYMILKHLSDNGIDRATDFLENNFENV